MSKSKYINTFNTTAEYDAYIESALPEFPNVGYDKQTGKVNIRRQSPNNYQIWGTTTATSNFNIQLNSTNVEVTVDPILGEFYLQGWTGTLTSLYSCFQNLTHITSIKKFALDTSNITSTSNIRYMFSGSSNIKSINLNGFKLDNVTSMPAAFDGAIFMYGTYQNIPFTDIYITDEHVLNLFTNNLTSANGNGVYISSTATIHYNDVDYKWQNNAWTPQSV